MTDVEKTHSGEVCWFSNLKGYGFINWEIEGAKQPDIFVHFSDIACEGFKSLHKGQQVSFNIGANRNGDPKAINIMVLQK